MIDDASLRVGYQDQTEEVHVWKVRCQEAQAEVRALKNRTRHADPPPANNSSDGQTVENALSRPAGSRLSPRRKSPEGLRAVASSLQAARLQTKSGWQGLLGDHFAQAGNAASRSEVREIGVQKDNDDDPNLAEVAKLQEELQSMRAAAAVAEAAVAQEPQHMEIATETAARATAVAAAAAEVAAAEAQQRAAAETVVKAGKEKETVAAPSSRENTVTRATGSGEVKELEHKLRNKDLAIVQLQADMGREKAQLEKQRRAAEKTNIFCNEELQMMTERAAAISEQLKKYKKKASELVGAREEIARLGSGLTEHEAALARRTSAHEALQTSNDEAIREVAVSRMEAVTLREELVSRNAELESYQPLRAQDEQAFSALEERMASTTLECSEAREQHEAALSEVTVLNSTLEEEKLEALAEKARRAAAEELAAAQDDASSIWDDDTARKLGAGSRRTSRQSTGCRPWLSRCIGTLSDLHMDLQQELASGAGAFAGAASSSAGGADIIPGERVMTRLARQLERAQRLLTEKAPFERSPYKPSEFSSDDYKHLLPEGLPQKLAREAGDLFRQHLNEQWIVAEVAREELMQEHSDEVDDLVRCHDLERWALQREVNQMRGECGQSEAGLAAARPMREIRAHFEQQVGIVKRDLIAQLSGAHERHREQRGNEEREFEQLFRDLQSCQSEAASSKGEFTVLATLYEEECRANLQLREDQRALESRAEASSWARGASVDMPPGSARDGVERARDRERDRQLMDRAVVASGSLPI
eukprot:TRINITY_DN4097_c0_g1_i2.p1 TRINITY_DN4097_c0_g1~~TRINITY_DN4097_c0_g1_i2.p1  ORF type:complete len:765 (-),score=199.62 TRINITY_DN4097_c0_g1_i2:494-2788(-)